MAIAIIQSVVHQKTNQIIIPQLWLLLVGVNQYQDEQLSCLRYLAVDCHMLAEAITTATQEQFLQVGVAECYIRLLRNRVSCCCLSEIGKYIT